MASTVADRVRIGSMLAYIAGTATIRAVMPVNQPIRREEGKA